MQRFDDFLKGEEYFDGYSLSEKEKQIARYFWDSSCKEKDNVIAKQNEELDSLRRFANEILNCKVFGDLAKNKAKKYRIIDENGNPTKLLDGVIKCK